MTAPWDPPPVRRWPQVAGIVVLGLLAVIVPLRSTSIFTTDLTQLTALVLAFAGLNLLTHHLGLLSLGQGAFVGLGSACALHSVNDFGLPPMLMPLVGLVFGFAVGAIIAVPALRLPKAYLALLTLSLAVAFPIVLRQIDGPLPVTLDGEFIAPSWTGIAPKDEHLWEYGIVLAWTLVTLFVLHRTLAGPLGRAFVASRDNPQAAAAFGIPVYRLRLLGVATSGALAGLAGGLLVIPVNFTDGPLYQSENSIKMFALAMAFGGQRLLYALPASVMFVLLPVWIDDRNGWRTATGLDGIVKSEAFIYAVLLLLTAYLTGGRGFAQVFERRRRRQPAGGVI